MSPSPFLMLSSPLSVTENFDLWPGISFQPVRSLPMKIDWPPRGLRVIVLRRRTEPGAVLILIGPALLAPGTDIFSGFGCFSPPPDLTLFWAAPSAAVTVKEPLLSLSV